MSHARHIFTAAAALLLLGLASAQNLRATGNGPQTQQQPQPQDTRPPRPTEEVLSPIGVVSAPQTAEVSPIDPSSSTSVVVPPPSLPPKPVAVSVSAGPAVEQPPAGGQEMEGTVHFVMPTINGLPVDYCSSYQHSNVPSERRGIDCGLPAANRYCRSQGYDGATEDFIVTYYSNRATLTMADVSLHAADPPEDGKGRHTFYTSITCRFPGHVGEGGVTADMAVVPSAGGVHRVYFLDMWERGE